MRRKDREMDEDFAMQVAEKCSYGVLSMILPDGRPYGVPLSVCRMGNSMYFHCAMSGQKTEALGQNPQVSLTCVGTVKPYPSGFTMEYESAVITGIAVPVTEETEKLAALRTICEKYCPENMDAFEASAARSLPRTAVWRIEIVSITGKRKKYDAEGKEMTFGRME